MEKIREMQFAEMIKKARKQADLSQRGLSQAAHLIEKARWGLGNVRRPD